MTRKSMLCGLANQGSVYPPSSLFLTSHAQSDNHHNFRTSLGTFWFVSCSGGSWYGVELVKSLHTWKHACVGRVRHLERKEREGELLAACCTVCVCVLLGCLSLLFWPTSMKRSLAMYGHVCAMAAMEWGNEE